MGEAHGLASDPLDILLRHDHWGTRKVLGLCRGLSPEQFQQKFDMGLGSLHEILSHLIGAMRRWADRLEQRPVRPAVDNPPRNKGMPSDYRIRTPDELIDLLDPAADELAQIAARLRAPGGPGLDSVIEIALDGTTYRLTRGAGLVHVTTHGAHHRAQCVNLLRRLGVGPLPEVMVIDWQIDTQNVNHQRARTTTAPSRN